MCFCMCCACLHMSVGLSLSFSPLPSPQSVYALHVLRWTANSDLNFSFLFSLSDFVLCLFWKIVKYSFLCVFGVSTLAFKISRLYSLRLSNCCSYCCCCCFCCCCGGCCCVFICNSLASCSGDTYPVIKLNKLDDSGQDSQELCK